MEDLDDDAVQLFLRTVLLLTSSMAWLYWQDYLGLDPAARQTQQDGPIKTRTAPPSPQPALIQG